MVVVIIPEGATHSNAFGFIMFVHQETIGWKCCSELRWGERDVCRKWVHFQGVTMTTKFLTLHSVCRTTCAGYSTRLKRVRENLSMTKATATNTKAVHNKCRRIHFSIFRLRLNWKLLTVHTFSFTSTQKKTIENFSWAKSIVRVYDILGRQRQQHHQRWQHFWQIVYSFVSHFVFFL